MSKASAFYNDGHASLHTERKKIQAFKPITRIEKRFLVDGTKYYNMAGGLANAFDFKDELSEKFYNDIAGQKLGHGMTFEVASVNFSRLHEPADIFLTIAEFFKKTGTILVGVQHKRENENEAWDQILTCHPVNHTNENPDLTKTDETIRDKFYGFLVARDVISTKDLEDSAQFSEKELESIEKAKKIFSPKSLA